MGGGREVAGWQRPNGGGSSDAVSAASCDRSCATSSAFLLLSVGFQPKV